VSGVTGDELTAVSLVVATIGVVYGSWYPEIRAAQGAAIPPNVANRDSVRQQLRYALYWRAAPLAGGASLMAILGFQLVFRVGAASVKAVSSETSTAYDSVSAFYIAAYVFLVLLAVVAIREVVLLSRRLSAANRP
jgi:hypothetical protein